MLNLLMGPCYGAMACIFFDGSVYGPMARASEVLIAASSAQLSSNGWTLSPARFPGIGKSARLNHHRTTSPTRFVIMGAFIVWLAKLDHRA